MGWADFFIDFLEKNNEVEFRPTGNSMQPKIQSKDLVKVIKSNSYKIDDIVLCKVKGKQYLHLITAISNNRYQISNNKGFVNGWIGVNAIYGICVKINNKTI